MKALQTAAAKPTARSAPKCAFTIATAWAAVRPYFRAVLHVRGMLDELIGPADSGHRGGNLLFAEQFQNAAAVAARQNVILERDHQVRRPAKNSVVPASSGLVNRGLIMATSNPLTANCPAVSRAIFCMLPSGNRATFRSPF